MKVEQNFYNFPAFGRLSGSIAPQQRPRWGVLDDCNAWAGGVYGVNGVRYWALQTFLSYLDGVASRIVAGFCFFFHI